MEPEYNAEEIETAAKKLKNKETAARDEVSAELIKYGSRELYKQIASLLNATSETGDYPEEIKRGIPSLLFSQNSQRKMNESMWDPSYSFHYYGKSSL